MKKTAPICTILLMAAMAGTAGIAAAEPALTVRATELQAEAQADAATISTLPENARVEILDRKGAWSRVKTAGGQSGWVRMLNLKPEAAGSPPAAAQPGALNNLLTSGRTSNRATVTTGVRGLSDEDLRKAQAEQAELQKAKEFAADKAAAEATVPGGAK